MAITPQFDQEQLGTLTVNQVGEGPGAEGSPILKVAAGATIGGVGAAILLPSGGGIATLID